MDGKLEEPNSRGAVSSLRQAIAEQTVVILKMSQAEIGVSCDSGSLTQQGYIESFAFPLERGSRPSRRCGRFGIKSGDSVHKSATIPTQVIDLFPHNTRIIHGGKVLLLPTVALPDNPSGRGIRDPDLVPVEGGRVGCPATPPSRGIKSLSYRTVTSSWPGADGGAARLSELSAESRRSE